MGPHRKFPTTETGQANRLEFKSDADSAFIKEVGALGSESKVLIKSDVPRAMLATALQTSVTSDPTSAGMIDHRLACRVPSVRKFRSTL